MQFTMAGVILFTEHYERCVAFYRSVLELEVMHQIDREGETLTAFSLGGTYLMIETGGRASTSPKNVAQTPAKLRFNVPDVATAAETLRSKGVSVTVAVHDWGTTAEFMDPDGNPCALRSDAGFGQ